MIEVVMPSGPTFDASVVDVASLRFGPGHAKPAYNSLTDENGARALIAAFRLPESKVAPGALNACVTGFQNDGIPFEGCDLVKH